MIFRPLILLAALAALAVGPASAIEDGSVRVSLDYHGNQLGASSGSVFGAPSLSVDGNLVAYESAGQGVPEDTNGAGDVYFRNMDEQPVSLVSVTASGSAGNNRSSFPSMSADGRYIAFESMASDLIEGDGNAMPDIFLRDREDGTTVRVSAAPQGADADGPAAAPAVSADGTSVAFCSRASNLAPDDNTSADAFVYDIASGAVTRVAPPDGASGEGCRRVALSSDGTILAYSYTSGSGAGTSQVYRTDLTTGETISISSGNGDSGADALAISDDGATIAFASEASDLVVDDDNNAADVFLWQAADGSLTRVSVAPDGADGDGDSGLFGVSLSGDAKYVVYTSAAANLVPNDYNGASDVFRLDRELNETRLGSATTGDRAPNASSYSPAVSDDGKAIAFVSLATNVVYGDRNGQPDVFMRAGVFPNDAGLPLPTEGPSDGDPVIVPDDEGGGVSTTIIYGGVAAVALLALAGGWVLLGRKPKA